jgi:hypothetical protein
MLNQKEPLKAISCLQISDTGLWLNFDLLTYDVLDPEMTDDREPDAEFYDELNQIPQLYRELIGLKHVTA